MDELIDPSYRETSQLQKKAKVQAVLLRDFRKRWCHEYLAALREYHRASGNNKQSIREGDVVVVHDDTPRATWRMAVVTDLIAGRDGLIRAAVIRTANGNTTGPITKQYPLELNATEEKELGVEKSLTATTNSDNITPDPDSSGSEPSHPQRASARKATYQVKEW
ncbi:uncharacterized protein, partial [Dysidea avara]|uniref:uncharacterized protein n=1 Tax=Dysidea avara TaxID=196820 RepID=UPI00332E4EFC